MPELYQADFHKPGIYESGQVRANAWDAFRRMPFRGGRGHRLAVGFVVGFGCGGISCFFFLFVFFERAWTVASMRPPCFIYLSTSTDCESCTRAISTNPGYMEASEYGLTCGTCFVERHPEVVAVAGLLWISWCVLGAAGFRVFSPRFFFFERSRPAASMRPSCLICLYTSTVYTWYSIYRLLIKTNNNSH